MRDPEHHHHPDLLDSALELEPTEPATRWGEDKPLIRCRCGAQAEEWRIHCRWCGRQLRLLT